jgi:hypothetical protein
LTWYIKYNLLRNENKMLPQSNRGMVKIIKKKEEVISIWDKIYEEE